MARSGKTRTTVAEIAMRAGVSKATVDRVLNGRDGVQVHTRQHVLSAMRQLNGEEPAIQTALPETVNLDFIIPDHRNAFLAEQAHHIETYCRSIGGVSAIIHHLASANEEALLQAISKIGKGSEGVGVIGVDTAKVRHALREFHKRNIPVVTLASDIRQIGRSAYFGIDNYAAGRLAGYLVGKLTTEPRGKAAIILGLRAYFGHEEREMGFRSILRDQFPNIKIVAEHEVAEDDDRARDTLLDLLTDHPDLNSIYCIGSGQTGIVDALHIREKAESITVIGHGLTDDTQQYLIDGAMDAIINENSEEEARAAVDYLKAAARGHALPALSPIAIQAIFPENIPQ